MVPVTTTIGHSPIILKSTLRGGKSYIDIWNRNVVYDSEAVSAPEKRRRVAYLFPWNATGLKSRREDCDGMVYLTPELDLELENVTSAASVVHCWSLNVPTTDTISIWAELWNDNMCADTATELSLHDDPGTRSNSDSDLVQTLMTRVHDILEKRQGTHQHIQLLFLVPTMAYCSPCHQATFLAMLIAFAKESQPHSEDPPIYAET